MPRDTERLDNKPHPPDVEVPIKRPHHLLLAASALTVALLVIVLMPDLLGSDVQRALTGLSSARPIWLWLAGVCFLCSLVGSAGAWRSAIGLVGGRIGWLDAGARYGIGSLINSFAPARLGDVARLALFSRALDSDERVWRAGGSFMVIGVARARACGADSRWLDRRRTAALAGARADRADRRGRTRRRDHA